MSQFSVHILAKSLRLGLVRSDIGNKATSMVGRNLGMRILENVWIPLSDGTRLAARIWLPDETFSQPVPAILEYLPYRKRGGSEARDDATYPHFAKNGYAGIRVDIRGNGESDGWMEDEYSAQELSDGLEVIAWIAAQDWCDGHVGMIGISWGGFNGLQLAALRPPALKCIVTACSTDDRYSDDIHYMGGCLLNDNATWSQQMLNYSSRPPDPELVGPAWRDIWLERLKRLPFLAHTWLGHQRRDAYWKHGSVCEDFDRIDVPVLAVGGWYDAYTDPILRLLEGLSAPCKAIIGPWEHKYPNISRMTPSFDFLSECVRWWDRWLKGHENGACADPALRAYVIEDAPAKPGNGHRNGRWVAVENWPSKLIGQKVFHLSAAGLVDGDKLAKATGTKITISSPMDHGLMAGNFCPGMRIDNELPGDQRDDDAKAAVFDSEILSTAYTILGRPEIELRISSDKPVALISARICDVAPDGASTRVCHRPLNLTHRDSHEYPEPLQTGRIYTIRFRLSAAGHVFAQGHRIRLALATSYWPILWPSPEPAALTLHIPGSSLNLPVPLARLANQAMDPAPKALQSNLDILRAPSHCRVTEQQEAGLTLLRSEDDLGRFRNRQSGLETESKVQHLHWINPDDPLSAKTEARWAFATGRGDWQISTRSWTRMTADGQAFNLSAGLEAFEGDELIFERTWEEIVERDHV